MLLELKQILPLLIPIIAIVGGIAVALLVMVLDYKKKAQLLELHHKERLAALERGLELPPLPGEFFDNAGGRGRDGGRSDPQRALRRGLVFVLGGLAVSAALVINRDLDSAAWGLVPIAVGVAYLLSSRLGGPAR